MVGNSLQEQVDSVLQSQCTWKVGYPYPSLVFPPWGAKIGFCVFTVRREDKWNVAGLEPVTEENGPSTRQCQKSTRWSPDRVSVPNIKVLSSPLLSSLTCGLFSPVETLRSRTVTHNPRPVLKKEHISSF